MSRGKFNPRGRCPRRAISVWFGAVVASSLTLSACASGGGDAEKSTLTVMVAQSVSSASIQVGDDQGFFDDEGVTLEVINSQSGAATVTGLTAGAVDIGGPPATLVIPAMNLGAPIKSLMNAYDFDVTLVAKPGILAPGSTYPENMTQLKGLRVGISGRGSALEQAVAGSLEAAGMGAEDVAYVAIGVGQSAVQAFQNDQVDVAALIAPDAVFLVDGSYEVAATPEELLATALSPDYIYSGWAASAKTLEEKADTVTAFCRAMKRSEDFIRDPANKEAVATSFATWMSLTPEVADDTYDLYAGHFTTALTQERWNGQAEFLAPDSAIPPFEDATLASCVEIANR